MFGNAPGFKKAVDEGRLTGEFKRFFGALGLESNPSEKITQYVGNLKNARELGVFLDGLYSYETMLTSKDARLHDKLFKEIYLPMVFCPLELPRPVGAENDVAAKGAHLFPYSGHPGSFSINLSEGREGSIGDVFREQAATWFQNNSGSTPPTFDIQHEGAFVDAVVGAYRELRNSHAGSNPVVIWNFDGTLGSLRNPGCSQGPAIFRFRPSAQSLFEYLVKEFPNIDNHVCTTSRYGIDPAQLSVLAPLGALPAFGQKSRCFTTYDLHLYASTFDTPLELLYAGKGYGGVSHALQYENDGTQGHPMTNYMQAKRITMAQFRDRIFLNRSILFIDDDPIDSIPEVAVLSSRQAPQVKVRR